MRIHLSFVFTAALAAVTMIAGAARAEDLPQTKARQALAATNGLGASSLAVLERVSTMPQSEVSAALIGKLRPSGQDWSLEVSSDGAAAEYHDLAVESRAHALGRPLAEEMPASELEHRGRAFIASKLASQIVLEAGEELIALRADYRTEGGQDLATGAITRAVVANRIVFGRMRGGVPVVGNGSKVIITFVNDGSVESFRYDWPAYQAGAVENIADAGELLSRVQKVMTARTGAAAQLEALECGYYDAGSFARQKPSSVQPGCTYRAVAQDANGMRQGYAGAVPAGASFSVDDGWLETRLLSK